MAVLLDPELLLKEKAILRNLAEQVAKIAALPVQQERARLWLAMNHLHPERPLILADPQNGWEELVPETDLECRNPLLRGWEMALRRLIFRHQAIHDDWPVTGWLNVHWVVEAGGYGLQETQLRSGEKGSYTWDAPIKNEKDFEQLHPREIKINRDQTALNLSMAEDIFSGILDVRLFGEAVCRAKLTRNLIHLRGLQQMMLDMYDHPKFMHAMMAFLRDDLLNEWQIYEREGLLTLNNQPDSLMGSGSLAHTDLLPSSDFKGQVRMKDMWCWGEAQETVGVSPQQFDEFVLEYQLPLINRFGLVDYGCCEPLDQKFDLLIQKIPNLRSLAVSPWCDRRKAAQKLEDRFVYVWKQNPSLLCSPQPDFPAVEKDIRDTLAIARDCCLVIVMKDTSTFHNDSGRLTRWTDLASEIVNHGKRA
jgi:hypothetical protein